EVIDRRGDDRQRHPDGGEPPALARASPHPLERQHAEGDRRAQRDAGVRHHVGRDPERIAANEEVPADVPLHAPATHGHAAVAAVDARTLALLFGMMIVAAYLRLSGFFGLVTTWAMRRASTPVGALAAVVVAAGTLSALFVNDVICVVMAPLVVDLTRRLGLPPVPYLIALATAANVGSVATLTGNPQNMLIGSFSAISYRAFLLREAPVALVGLGW